MMAEYLDVDQGSISKCEKGNSQFSVDILDKAAELFGCTIDCFVNEFSTLITIPIALKINGFAIEDLKAFAAINKIALTLRFMEDLVEDEN